MFKKLKSSLIGIIAITLSSALLLTACQEDPFSEVDNVKNGAYLPDEDTKPAAAASQSIKDKIEAGKKQQSGDDEAPDSTPADPKNEKDSKNEEEAKEETPAKKALSPSECVVGDWKLDNKSFADILKAATGFADNVSGTVIVKFKSDGSTSTEYKGWTHTIQSEGHTATVERNGKDEGVYVVDDAGFITIIEMETGSSVTMEVMGMTMEAGGGDDDVFQDAEFRCEGDTMSLTSQGATSVLNRM